VFAERGGDPERPGKRHRLDCLVWRQARPGEPAWDSWLGRGRPGWHVECTAISLDLLGEEFDVQAGGRDLAFPHHPMCAAEARVATGRPMARVFLHAGMVGLDGEKMSKSRGNLAFVSALRQQGVDPAAIRLAILAQHYRGDWDWTPRALADAEQRLDRWRDALARQDGPDAAPMLARVRRHLADDLDAPSALSAVDRWAAEQLSGGGSSPGAPGVVARALDALLGLRL
jgi:L-cysteine:1D-myo-inositol 2-amino-2-deoxy-alpha-D-glucopyranoside ligase